MKRPSAQMVGRVSSLGLFILDTFEWKNGDGTSRFSDGLVIGGGGTYAIVGARMWLPPSRVGMIVDRGADWHILAEGKVQAKLDEFGPCFVFRDHAGETCRSLNIYDDDHRDFKYLTERIRLEPLDLMPTPLVPATTWLHFVCSPTRALTIIGQITSFQAANPDTTWRPKLCYEPIPERCVPGEFESLKKVLPSLSVFSPNHEEAWSFFGVTPAEANAKGQAGIEEVARKFFEHGAVEAVVIRSGKLGAFCLRKEWESGKWVDAYHTSSEKVVDVTGAGNSFLGGLMGGLEQDPEDLITACAKASISASFIIEQFGLPVIGTMVDAEGKTKETWNGVDPDDRLAEMMKRGFPPGLPELGRNDLQ